MIFALCILTNTCCYARSEKEVQLGVTSDNTDSELGISGFCMVYKMIFPTSVNDLSWTVSAGATVSNLSHEYSENVGDDLLDMMHLLSSYAGGYYNFEANKPKTINIPVLVGLQYETCFSPKTSLFGNAGFGLNIFKMTAFNYSFEYSNGDFAYILNAYNTFKPTIGLGFHLGVGVLINKKYSLSLNYVDLGSYNLEKLKANYGRNIECTDAAIFVSEINTTYKPLTISMLNLKLGYCF